MGISRERQTREPVCQAGHPRERYTALNLHPLGKKGTIEFRRHAGTHNIERVLRYVQFVTTFVETFKDDQRLNAFFEGDAAEAWRQLYMAQRMATTAELFDKLAIEPNAAAYYEQHQWNVGDNSRGGSADGNCALARARTVEDISVPAGYVPVPLMSSVQLDDLTLFMPG